MTTLRTHFTFRVDTWIPNGESIVEHIGGVEDYQVALATYRAARESWLGMSITLRQGGACAWCPVSKSAAGFQERLCWRLAILKNSRQTYRLKISLESGCRMSQRWDDFFAH